MRIDKPYRRGQTATINVAADPNAVFALMCPVREYEWEPGWTTNLILSNSGLVEKDCIFTTPAGASAGSTDESGEALWVTSEYDADARRLTMIKFTPGECVTRLDIAVAPTDGGSTVTTSYEHTALNERGRKIVDDHDAANLEAMMSGWRERIEALPGREKSARFAAARRQ